MKRYAIKDRLSKAPWRVSGFGSALLFILQADGFGFGEIHNNNESTATNAAVIQHAPDMVEALTKIAAAVGPHDTDPHLNAIATVEAMKAEAEAVLDQIHKTEIQLIKDLT